MAPGGEEGAGERVGPGGVDAACGVEAGAAPTFAGDELEADVTGGCSASRVFVPIAKGDGVGPWVDVLWRVRAVPASVREVPVGQA